MNNKPVHYGQFWIKKVQRFWPLRATPRTYFDLSTRLGKSPLNIIQNNQKITILKNTIAAHMYSFCTFWDQSTLLWQYITKHSASNAEELNLHHEKHELLIIHTVFLWRAISFFASVCIELWAKKSPNAPSLFSNTFLFEYGLVYVYKQKYTWKIKVLNQPLLEHVFPII